MNPLDWDAIQTLQRRLSSNHQNDVNNSMVNASSTNSEWDVHCKYVRRTADEAQRSMGVNVGWEGLGPPSHHNFYMKNSEVPEDPDGEPLEMDEEDRLLTRKRKELREIEERILYRKASIARKAVDPFVKKTTFPDTSSATRKAATLRDRVNIILQQRIPARFLSKVNSPKGRMSSSSSSKDGLVQDDHPLKRRVRALMKQRCRGPFVLPASREVSDIAPRPPSRSVTSPAREENDVNEGFQRFLSVLNKGVDMDLLSRIVNDDNADIPVGAELLNIEPPAVENKSDEGFRRESLQFDSGASPPGHSGTDSGERNTDRTSRGRSLDDRLPLPDNDEQKNDRRDRCFGSSSRSKSPSPVKKKKKKKEEKPKAAKQHEQLQNILKTLGLSLEVEEMSKLADRTQERLYGKKHEDTAVDSRGEQESWQTGCQRCYSNSSSSSSSSSSSRSTSRSCSRSPARHWSSHSRERRQSPERSRSRDGSRDGLPCQDGNQDSKDAQRHGDNDEDGQYPKEISAYRQPYPQNHTYPHPHPAAPSAFPDYSSYQNSQYIDYYSGTYSEATDSYWAPTQSAGPTSFYPRECPYPENTYHQFPDSIVAPNMVYHHMKPKYKSLDTNLLINPDLSRSEGQTGYSGLRCLQMVTAKQPAPDRCLHRLTNHKKIKGKLETRRLRWQRRKVVLKARKLEARQSAKVAEKTEAPQIDEEDSEAQESEEEKQPPTKEEVKANLRKMLEAFNQKVKEKVTQPANSLTSLTD